MAVTKEYREFFLRAVKVTSGSKADQQTNYSVEYQVTDANGNQIMAFNRFLKDHFPSEDVFRKLFESLTFKLNVEDKAKTEEQGLVRIVKGVNIFEREDANILEYRDTGDYDKGSFVTVVLPSTLPIVTAGDDISVDVRIRRVSDDAIVAAPLPDEDTLYYMEYVVTNTAPNVPPVIPPDYEHINSPYKIPHTSFNGLIDDPNNANYAVLGTHLILGGKVATNHSFLEYDVHWVKADGLLFEPSIEIFIGNDANINNCRSIGIYNMIDHANIGKAHIVHLNVQIHRDDIDRFFSKVILDVYQTSAPMTGYYSNGRGFLNPAGNSNLYEDAFRVITDGDTLPDVINWGNDLRVHFRLKKDGALDQQTENRYRIHGRAYNPTQ